jgi:hypothetical protein
MKYQREEKAKLLEDWRLSGKSISAYVKEKGLFRWTFTKWLKGDRERKCSFVQVSAAKMKPTPNEKEIVVEKGELKIHIPLGIGSEELRTIIGTLGAAV